MKYKNNIEMFYCKKTKAANRCGINSLDKGVEEKIKKRDYTFIYHDIYFL